MHPREWCSVFSAFHTAARQRGVLCGHAARLGAALASSKAWAVRARDYVSVCGVHPRPPSFLSPRRSKWEREQALTDLFALTGWAAASSILPQPHYWYDSTNHILTEPLQ